jgi:hypothetical protein
MAEAIIMLCCVANAVFNIRLNIGKQQQQKQQWDEALYQAKLSTTLPVSPKSNGTGRRYLEGCSTSTSCHHSTPSTHLHISDHLQHLMADHTNLGIHSSLFYGATSITPGPTRYIVATHADMFKYICTPAPTQHHS